MLWMVLVMCSCGESETVAPSAVGSAEVSGNATPGGSWSSRVPTERDRAFADLQASSMSGAAQAQANEWIQAAGRPTLESEGRIQKEIDFSLLTTDYYAPGEAVSIPSEASPNGEPLAILDYGPDGEIPAENNRPSIYVMFNKAMGPLGQLGQDVPRSDILQIEPDVPGTYRWYGTRTLSFIPAEPLVQEPLYRITVAAGTRSLGGGVFAGGLFF